MAEYTFGQDILRYIQNQDEINLRAKALAEEETRYKSNMAFQERQSQLAEQRFLSNYALNLAQFEYERQKDFEKENVLLKALPEDVRSRIPTEQYKMLNEEIYVPESAVTNIEQGLAREREQEADEMERERIAISQGNLDVSRGSLAETKRYHDYLMSQEKINTTKAQNEKTYKENIALANENLVKLKALYDSGGKEDAPKDYETYKGAATKAVYNTLNAIGITNEDLDYIRMGGDLSDEDKIDFSLKAQEMIDKGKDNTKEFAVLKRDFYSKVINNIADKLTYQELEALKLWNEVGTR